MRSQFSYQCIEDVEMFNLSLDNLNVLSTLFPNYFREIFYDNTRTQLNRARDLKEELLLKFKNQ